jgi:alpha-N-acetylglucosamine transferase
MQLLLVTTDVKPHFIERAKGLGTQLLMKPPLSVAPSLQDQSYHNQPSKIYLWNLTEYKKIVYYDSDFIFTHSPTTCVDHCADDSKLCAVKDTATWLSRERGFKYFNAGFLILTPSEDEFAWLLANYHKAARRQFAEQDLLNDRFRGKWHELKKVCNHQMGTKFDYLQETGIAFHAKTWEIKSLTWLPEGLRSLVLLQ